MKRPLVRGLFCRFVWNQTVAPVLSVKKKKKPKACTDVFVVCIWALYWYPEACQQGSTKGSIGVGPTANGATMLTNGKPQLLIVTGTVVDIPGALELTRRIYAEAYKRGDFMPIAPALEISYVFGAGITAAHVEAMLPRCEAHLATGNVKRVKFVGRGNGHDRLRALAGSLKVEVLG